MYYYRQIVFATSFIQFFTVNKATICQIMESKAANSQNTLVHGGKQQQSGISIDWQIISHFFHEKETQKLLTILLLLNILLTGGFWRSPSKVEGGTQDGFIVVFFQTPLGIIHGGGSIKLSDAFFIKREAKISESGYICQRVGKVSWNGIKVQVQLLYANGLAGWVW